MIMLIMKMGKPDNGYPIFFFYAVIYQFLALVFTIHYDLQYDFVVYRLWKNKSNNGIFNNLKHEQMNKSLRIL